MPIGSAVGNRSSIGPIKRAQTLEKRVFSSVAGLSTTPYIPLDPSGRTGTLKTGWFGCFDRPLGDTPQRRNRARDVRLNKKE